MSEALTVVNDPVVSSVHLVARNPVEMQNAQADLAVWLKNKVIDVKIEIKDLGAAVSEARDNGWSLTTLTRQRNKVVGQLLFYSKILAAVEAGYTIIPEFPIDVFAIRVTRSNTRAKQQSSTYSTPHIADERPDLADIGKGQYFSPSQAVYNSQYKETDKSGKEITRYYSRAANFRDVVFPVRAARIEIMKATAEAMAMKVFDQIGICEPRINAGTPTRRGDPLIIGQILGKREGWNQRCVSFIIAWHLDLRTL